MKLWLCSLTLLFCFACSSDLEMNEELDSRYLVGEYININYIVSEYPSYVYDQYGNIIDYVTLNDKVYNQKLVITEKGLDSLNVGELVADIPFKVINGIVEDSTFVFFYDRSFFSYSDVFKGRIWLEADSIKIEYDWKRSDSNANEPESLTRVMGSGIRK